MVPVFVDAHFTLTRFPMVVHDQSVLQIHELLFHGLQRNYAILVISINVWTLITENVAKSQIQMTLTLIHLMHTKLNCKTQGATQLSDFQMTQLLLSVRFEF